MKIIISQIPVIPSSLKFTAHGYMKMTSTSNKTKRIATRKYLIENGIRALPCDSIPHSKVSSFAFAFRFGPNMWVANMTKITKPRATKNCSRIGRKSEGRLFEFIGLKISLLMKLRQIYAFLSCKWGFRSFLFVLYI